MVGSAQGLASFTLIINGQLLSRLSVFLFRFCSFFYCLLRGFPPIYTTFRTATIARPGQKEIEKNRLMFPWCQALNITRPLDGREVDV
jgi:hypothetical protein